jgi:hypothetical protein
MNGKGDAMCNRCYNIKAQMILREMYKRLLDRSPTPVEMRDFSKNLPKPRRMVLPDSYKVMLEIELEYLKGVALGERFKGMSEEDKDILMKKMLPLIRVP